MRDFPPLNNVFYVEYEKDSRIEYSIIKVSQARDNDGTLANFTGEGLVIQGVVIPNLKPDSKYYMNFWDMTSMKEFLQTKADSIESGKGFLRKE